MQEKLPNLSIREAYIIFVKTCLYNSRLAGFWTYFTIGLEVVRDNPVQNFAAVDFLRYRNAVRGKAPSVWKQNDICFVLTFVPNFKFKLNMQSRDNIC